MKNLFFRFFVLVSVIACISCTKETSNNQDQGNIEFALGDENTSSLQKSLKVDTIENASAVIISVEDVAGKDVYSDKRIDLYRMNGYYLSTPLPFAPGNYKLKKFLVVDAANNVLYATPLKGSLKAYLVSNPLPISFTVTKNSVTKVVPEVLSCNDSKPEDFGYSTFSFSVVKTFSFRLSVFKYNTTSKNFELTDALLTVLEGTTKLFDKNVPAVTDTITLMDSNASYIFKITKAGFKTWSDTLSITELKKYSNSPLEIILTAEEEVIIESQESAMIETWPSDPIHYDNANMGGYNGTVAKAWTSSGVPFICRSLLKFDLSQIPSNTAITSAILYLYGGVTTSHGSAHEALTHSNEFYVKRITSDWTEYGVTWNTQPSTTTYHQVLAYGTNSMSTQNYNIDITSLINDMINDNKGMMIQLANETMYASVVFGSDDAPAGRRPVLKIKYR